MNLFWGITRPAYSSVDTEAFKEIVTKLIEGYSQFSLKGLAMQLEGKSWLFGEKIMICDFFFYETIKKMNTFCSELEMDNPVENLPNLKKFIERFEALPQIAAFMKKDKYMTKPWNAPFAQWGGK